MSRRHEAPTFDLSAARGRWIPLSSIQKMSEEDATEAFIHLRWKEGVICPHCAWYKCYQFKTRKIFKCGKCARQFSATTQTFFNSRKLPFKTILLALATLKQGSNAHRLHFDIGTTYKTALSIVHRIKARIDLPPAPYLQRHSVKDTHYPYIIGPVDDGAKLLIMVNEVVPRNIPEQIRSEVCQDLIVAILGGEIEIGDLAKKASVYIRRAFNLFPIRYGNLSLDEPAPWMRDSDRTLLEMLDSEVEHW